MSTTDALPVLTTKYYTADEVNFTPGERSFVAWVSTETVDREGDVVVASGVDFKSEYVDKNPVVMAVHDYGKWPLGQCEWLKVKSARDWAGLYGKARIDDDDDTEVVWKKIKSRTVRGVSIGFRPPDDMAKGEWGPPTADELKRNPHWKGAKRVIRRCVMIEFSVCPIGMNANALIEAVSKGLHRPRYAEPVMTREEIVESALAGVTLAAVETKGAALGRIGAQAADAVLSRLSDSLRWYLSGLAWDSAATPEAQAEKCRAACDEFCDAFVAALASLKPLDAGAVDSAFGLIARQFNLPASVAKTLPDKGPADDRKAAVADDGDDDEPDGDEDDGPVRKGHFVKVVKGPHRGAVGKVASVHRSGLVPDVDDDVPATKADPACRVKCYKAMGDGHKETDFHVGCKMAHCEKTDDLKPPKRTKGLPDPLRLPPIAGKTDAEIAAEKLAEVRKAFSPAAVKTLLEQEHDRRVGAV